MATFITIVVGVALVCPAVVIAGTGYAISTPISIDTRPPVMTVADPPPNTLLQGGQMINLSWAVNDDNPNPSAAANVAEIHFGDDLAASHPFAPGTGQHTWQWTVPDTTVGAVHLVVNSADAFGNLTVVRAANFTILSTATDVPDAIGLPVFALPSPNPFNPLTQLRFSLPEAGPVHVTVHDARGFLVSSLLHGNRGAGDFTLQWNGTDSTGRRQAGGTYFFRLRYRESGQLMESVHKGLLLP